MAAKKKKFDFSTMHLADIPRFILALFKGQIGPEEPMMNDQTGFYEINLVPDVKAEMIKAQKVRNIVFFICISISILSASIAVILGSIKGTQDITMIGQDNHIKELSDKITSYDELPEFLTIQNQLRGISEIEDNQKVLSRTFAILGAIIPDEGDVISVSEVNVELTSNTISFDALANAQAQDQPDIDYRVLESFIKRTNLMTFDYGRYVDSTGNLIPSRCIIEYDAGGKMFQENGNIYAIWRRGEKGCDPNRDDYTKNEDGSVTVSEIDIDTDTDLDSTKMNNGTSDVSEVKNVINPNKVNNTNDSDSTDEDILDQNTTNNEDAKKEDKEIKDYIPNEKIYRTPQFTNWYAGEPWKTSADGIDDVDPVVPEGANYVYNVTNYKYTPKMGLDGSISGIPHFESNCITYIGEEEEKEGTKKKTAKWSADNSCVLVPDGITIIESSNGLDSDENLVLSFRASITINADAFAFRNKHVMAIGPNGQNVTDSYVQLEQIFAAPAEKCESGNSQCDNAPANGGKEK